MHTYIHTYIHTYLCVLIATINISIICVQTLPDK